MFRDVDVDLDAVKAGGVPLKIPCPKTPDYFSAPLDTPSGKIELYSEPDRQI